MLMFVLQTAFLMLACYLVGCVLGSWLARLFPRPEDAVIATPATKAIPMMAPTPLKAVPETQIKPVESVKSAEPLEIKTPLVSSKPTPKPLTSTQIAERSQNAVVPLHGEKTQTEFKINAQPAKSTQKPNAAKTVSTKSTTPEVMAPSAEDAKHPGKRPTGYKKPVNNKPDDLKVIVGIGPVNEKKLNELGIYHFDQIASWKASEIKWVGSFLRFPDRIEREAWVSQAKNLIRFK